MSDAVNPESQGNSGYRVLARKYRPSNFDDLIGQEAMVRTISNSFEAGRVPQAWILTGVRGVGKTTTARILARALNYELPDGSVKGPTIHMPTMENNHDLNLLIQLVFFDFVGFFSTSSNFLSAFTTNVLPSSSVK